MLVIEGLAKVDEPTLVDKYEGYVECSLDAKAAGRSPLARVVVLVQLIKLVSPRIEL